MRRPILTLALMLSACSSPPAITWPAGPAAPAPALLPQAGLQPPPASPAPGAVLTARATALRASLGL